MRVWCKKPMTIDTVAVVYLAAWWLAIAGCLSVMAIALKREGVRVYRQWRVRRWLHADMQQAGYGDHRPLWK